MNFLVLVFWKDRYTRHKGSVERVDCTGATAEDYTQLNSPLFTTCRWQKPKVPLWGQCYVYHSWPAIKTWSRGMLQKWLNIVMPGVVNWNGRKQEFPLLLKDLSKLFKLPERDKSKTCILGLISSRRPWLRAPVRVPWHRTMPTASQKELGQM